MYYHRKKIFFIPLVLIVIVLFAYVTMALWNALIPEIFNVTPINFWQAAGLILLARLLFGFGHHRSWNNSYRPRMNWELRNKIKQMSPEEKKEFFRKMHYNRQMWHHGYCYDNEMKTDKKSADKENE